jgi:single-strand DNA-binding protein
MSDCTSTLSGNITRDPEFRVTTNGKGVASFGLAVNRRYQVDGVWQEQTSFFDVVAWSDLGQRAVASLHKGDRVIVTGRMEQRTWEGGDGAKRSKVEIVASDIGASVRFAEVQVARITRLETGPPGADAVAAAMADTTADARVDEEPF